MPTSGIALPGFNSITLKTKNKTLILALTFTGFPLVAQVPMQLPQSMIDMQKAALKQSGIRYESGELQSFAKKVKSVKLNHDTEDDVREKLGNPTMNSKFSGKTTWGYTFMTDMNTRSQEVVTASIVFGSDGKVLSVQITKGNGLHNETVYSKGDPMSGSEASSGASTKGSNHFPVQDSAPQNPTEGQIYFNSTDSHFYGWNGKEWRQLDK